VGSVLRRWWPVLLLLVLFGALQAKLWFGAGGWREAQALRATVEAQRIENARLQQRNDALTAEVEDLKSGETAVEERARSELGMVKPGETFYRVVEPNPGAPHAAAPSPEAPVTAPAYAPPTGEPIEHKDAQHGEAGAPDAEPTH
jgi:cell division protein FtsB